MREEEGTPPPVVGIDHPEFAVLASEFLSRGLRLRFRASGGSMAPEIRSGDVVEVAPLGSDRSVRRGDIVLCRLPNGGIVLHRVVRIRGRRGERRILPKGDALAGPDGWIDPESVLGRAVVVFGAQGTPTRLDVPWAGIRAQGRAFVSLAGMLAGRIRCRVRGS